MDPQSCPHRFRIPLTPFYQGEKRKRERGGKKKKTNASSIEIIFWPNAMLQRDHCVFGAQPHQERKKRKKKEEKGGGRNQLARVPRVLHRSQS